MTNLRDSANQGNVKALQANLWGELLDADEKFAESYLTWCIKQVKENKKNQKLIELNREKFKAKKDNEKEEIQKQIRSVQPKGHPYQITKGDVVLVQFGINVGDEISDLQKDQTMKRDHGHYAVVLAQKGFMFLVVPLSSQPQSNRKNPDMEMCIEDLGIGNSDKSYVMFSQVNSIHIRRIKKIQSLLPTGKTSLNSEVLGQLEEKIVDFLGIIYKNEPLTLENEEKSPIMGNK